MSNIMVHVKNMTVEVNCQKVYENILRGVLMYHGFCFKYVGAGASRKVFRYGDIVFKLAKNEFGIFQNEAEVDLYTGISSKYEDMICPILWFSDDYKVLICKYAEPLYTADGWHNDTRYSIDDVKEYREKMHYEERLAGRLLDLRSIYRLDAIDLLKISSWGMLDGKAVLIDYGYNSYVSRNCIFSLSYRKKVLDI